MERMETGAMIDSLRGLENYYQSKYEHYLAMATEAKENRERVELLLLDLGRDVSYPDNLVKSDSIDRQQKLGANLHRSLDNQRVIQELPQAKPEIESPPLAVPTGHQIVDEQKEASPSVEQMKRWTLDLFKAMSVIESVSNSDSGKTLHQNYLHHLINRELDIELSSELVELYLEEAIRRDYLEPDEFNNNCYIAKPKNNSKSEASESPILNIATDKATNRDSLLGRKSGKLYDLPPSDKLKPTLFETIEGYIESNPNKRFSIDDVVNYLYPQPIQSDWDKALRNKVRTSISNVLGRKGYLGKYWSRIEPGIYRPRRSN